MIARMICATLIAVVAGIGHATAQKIDDIPRLAVITAFEPEWKALEGKISERRNHTENGILFATGKISGQDVVVLMSGIGPVNAAMTAQMVIDRFEVSSLVFSGIAGGINPNLNIGDVIVPEQWGPFLDAIIARKSGEGFVIPPFLQTEFPNYGMIFPWSVFVRREGEEVPKPNFWFETDAELLELAELAAEDVELNLCDDSNNCLQHQPRIQIGGNGVSGSMFVDNAEFREYVHNTFDAHVVDMESAAVAQVSYSNSVPFIAFRSLSDLAGGGPGENQMGVFLNIAARNSSLMLEAFLARYGK